MNNSITYVTTNYEKLMRAKSILPNNGINVESVDLNCPEIQSDDIIEIARFSSEYSYKTLNKNIVKSDMGLFIQALDGFPGPYSNYIERKLDASYILKMLEGVSDRKAFYREVICFYGIDEKPMIFESVTQGVIGLTLDGEYGWNYDRIFIPESSDKSFANVKDDKRALMYSCEGWNSLAEYLLNHKEVYHKS